MARKSKITVHPAFKIGDISPRLYGVFLEPIGTFVNGSMYNPKHPTADENGFRQDWIDALKATEVPAVRLPGGNFLSGWNWKHSVGPKDKRRTQLDTAWYQYYTNEIGHDEYLQWTHLIGAEPMYTANLGTGNLQDAIDLVEYTNHKAGSYWADLRREYGHEEPYGVKTWYLGNEMDGPWQIGSWQKDPRGYGILSHEVSKGMKWTDPTIETIVCASCSPFLATYPEWDIDVLQECYETVDYISLHHYHIAPPGDYGALLGGSVHFENYIKTELAVCDYVQTKLRSPKQMMLSFDEFASRMQPLRGSKPGRSQVWEHEFDPTKEYVLHDPNNMDFESRFVNQGGDIVGALANAATLLVLLKYADRVKIGCMTRGLHALAHTNQNTVWKKAVHYPFTQMIKYGRGVSLRTSIECDTYDIPGYAPQHNFQYADVEGVGYIDAATAFDEGKGELNIFVINRDWEGSTNLDLDVSGFEGYKLVEHSELYSDDINAVNTFDNPDVVVPKVNANSKLENGTISAQLKPFSWNLFRLTK